MNYKHALAERLVKTALAVAAGAESVRQVQRAVGLRSTGTAARWVAEARAGGLVVSLAHEAGADKRAGLVLVPAVEVVAGVSPESGRWVVAGD